MIFHLESSKISELNMINRTKLKVSSAPWWFQILLSELSVKSSIYGEFEKQQKKHKHPIFCLLWKNSFKVLPRKLQIFLTMTYIEQKYWSSRYYFFKSTKKTGKNWYIIIIIVSITRRILKLRGFIENNVNNITFFDTILKPSLVSRKKSLFDWFQWNFIGFRSLFWAKNCYKWGFNFGVFGDSKNMLIFFYPLE